MQTLDQLRKEAEKLEEYLKEIRYQKNKNVAIESIANNNITVTDVKHMTPEQINDKWEVIKKLNFSNK